MTSTQERLNQLGLNRSLTFFFFFVQKRFHSWVDVTIAARPILPETCLPNKMTAFFRGIVETSPGDRKSRYQPNPNFGRGNTSNYKYIYLSEKKKHVGG